MAKPSIFTFDSNHVDFADDLVAVGDKARIDRPPIGDIKVTVP